MLTRYDEFPVHQSPYPFSRVPITDYSFDDGYYFGVFSPDERFFLFQGMRINPNSDVVGGYAGVMHDGVQYTVRFSRRWRPACDTVIGPYRYDFVEPFKEIRLSLGDNDSELAFDLRWLGLAPAFEEAHHFATNGVRVTTDQTRYTQSGTASGWIRFRGETLDVTPDRWYASRDHSWGLYAERAPLAPEPSWLPPAAPVTSPRALRFWTVFTAAGLTGFCGLHEAADGTSHGMNDTFGTPFEGRLSRGFDDDDRIELTGCAHRLEFHEGTRLLRRGSADLFDVDGRTWRLELDPVGPPWVTFPIGYRPGSWRDGGTIATYHAPGPAGVAIEWDRFDFSTQPVDHPTYAGQVRRDTYGAEYLSRVRVTAPDGTTHEGAGQTELFLDPGHHRYGS